MIMEFPSHFDVNIDEVSIFNKPKFYKHNYQDSNNYFLWIKKYKKEYHDILRYEGKDEFNDKTNRFFNEGLAFIEHHYLINYNISSSDRERRCLLFAFRSSLECLCRIWKCYKKSGLFGTISLQDYYLISDKSQFFKYKKDF